MQHGIIGRFVVATLLVTFGVTSPAAAVDLSGDYVVTVPIPCSFTSVQTGTALQLSGSCSANSTKYPLSLAGTVDPGTGAFSVTGAIPGLCADLACSGTGDGEESHSTCTSRVSACAGPISATKCGNGVIDPLENCEVGVNADGDCCSARCRLDPPGTACTNDGNDCTDDVCNGTGTCTHVPGTSPCDDGNACTIGDVCTGGACVPGAPAPAGQACNDDSDPCTTDVCGAGDAAGTCTHVPVPPAACRRAVACHSTCTQQLKECRQACRGRGQARRECRASCAQQSTCTAPGATIRTLAYVVTECSQDPQGMFSSRQKLLVRRGNCDPVTIKEFVEPPRPDPFQLCRVYGGSRLGAAERFFGPFQRLAVLPDGSGVVFEVTNQFSVSARPPLPEEGFFFVRSNGRGLRYLGPPSRFSLFAMRKGTGIKQIGDFFPVSPDGRQVAFFDLGAFDAAGDEAPQVFLLDLPSGQRRQLTHQSHTEFDPYLSAPICCQDFTNSRTVAYHTTFGTGAGGTFEVKTDGKSPEKEIPPAVVIEGSRVVPQFTVTSSRPQLVYVQIHEPGPDCCGAEVFLLDGKNLVQLTNFHRWDTFWFGGFITGGRVLFPASVNLHGENPAEICQLFSIDTDGAHLHQITHLLSDGRPVAGCDGATPANLYDFQLGHPLDYGCFISEFFLDRATGTVLFAASCDPVGGNPFGHQLFAMRQDGTGLRQLTNARGMTTDPDGTIHVELPGPFAYPSRPSG
jgi:hypothetical protein